MKLFRSDIMTREGRIFLNTEVNKLHGFIYTLDFLAEKLLREHLDIGYPDFLMMMMMDSMQACSQNHLVTHLKVNKSSVSKRVDSLTNKGIILRETNPDNRRQNIIKLSNKGNVVLIQSYKLLTEASEPFFAVLNDKRNEFKQMIEILFGGIEHDHSH